jgi:isorenieratene synthase
MGASLRNACVRDGAIVCPWHGLELKPSGHGDWKPVDAHDDGRLVWIRAIAAETPSERPGLPVRPERALDALIRHEVECEAMDIIANRLDPWHGAHFHPYSFARLRVLEKKDDEVTVRVVYRVVGRIGVEVDARFHCPDLRTIVMTIVRGDGTGSIVETHASPISPGRSAVFELTLATSDHPRFWPVVRVIRPLLRPLVRRAAARLWRDDAAYAERRYLLRSGRLPIPR